MKQIAIHEAGPQLDELITMVSCGNDVIITKNDGSAYKIIPYQPKPYPKFGSAKGLVVISDDFDDPIDGFEEYMP